MTAKKPAAKRSKNPLPPNGEWRNGQPIWRPNRSMRGAGWLAITLRTADGGWMSQGQAVDAINEINAAAAGRTPVPAWMAKSAPSSAATTPRPAGAGKGRTIGELVDAYLADPMPHGKPIKPKTVKHYTTYLAQFIATVAELKEVKPAAIRAQDISLLKTPEPGSGLLNYAAEAYKLAFTTKGANVSAAMIVAAKAWFTWVRHSRHLLVANPCDGIKHVKPSSDPYIWEPHEIEALIAAAEWAGLDSVADAIILSLDLTWSQADILKITWADVDANHRIYSERKKTGVKGNPRAAAAGRARLDAIRARWTGPEDLRPAAVIRSEADSGLDPWKADYFRHAFAVVRAIASADVGPGILGKTFAKLRNTGITMAYTKGLKTHQVAARSLHSAQTAGAIHAKYYHLIDQGAQDEATDMLDAPAPKRRRARLAAVV